jgi:hypothetical protein
LENPANIPARGVGRSTSSTLISGSTDQRLTRYRMPHQAQPFPIIPHIENPPILLRITLHKPEILQPSSIIMQAPHQHRIRDRPPQGGCQSSRVEFPGSFFRYGLDETVESALVSLRRSALDPGLDRVERCVDGRTKVGISPLGSVSAEIRRRYVRCPTINWTGVDLENQRVRGHRLRE